MCVLKTKQGRGRRVYVHRSMCELGRKPCAHNVRGGKKRNRSAAGSPKPPPELPADVPGSGPGHIRWCPAVVTPADYTILHSRSPSGHLSGSGSGERISIRQSLRRPDILTRTQTRRPVRASGPVPATSCTSRLLTLPGLVTKTPAAD